MDVFRSSIGTATSNRTKQQAGQTRNVEGRVKKELTTVRRKSTEKKQG